MAIKNNHNKDINRILTLLASKMYSGLHDDEESSSSLDPADYPLHRAAFENDVEEVKRLLQTGKLYHNLLNK
jgi:hypothetical protein